MAAMLGFQPDMWDYITFGAIFVCVVEVLAVGVFVLGLPGRIALARRHPEAEAVNLMGWVGFLAIVPWIQALIWAFKPTKVIDVRYFPREEARNIEEEIARLTGKTDAQKTPGPKDPATPSRNEPHK
jgi:hypothetical protein